MSEKINIAIIGGGIIGCCVALELAKEMIRQGVIMVPAFGNSSVLMVEPPLVISFNQIRAIVDAFAAACAKVNGINASR